MTHRFDVAHDPAVVARWCTLAEQRLDYLTELFQNGRWRRYYSHTAFLENIKEAKAMVAHWRALSTPGYVPEQRTPILIADLKPTSVPDAVEAAPDEILVDVASEAAPVDEAASAPALEVVDTMPSTTDPINDRYSLLRNLTL
jgi:uncharacterized repeat protein (TIGR03809 family)